LPSLAQGGLVAVGAAVGAHLLEHGVPTIFAAGAAGLAGGGAGAVIGLAFARFPRAGFAAATWIVTWLIAGAAESLDWMLGGSGGIVVSGGPSPTGHYELARAVPLLQALRRRAAGRRACTARRARGRDRPRRALRARRRPRLAGARRCVAGAHAPRLDHAARGRVARLGRRCPARAGGEAARRKHATAAARGRAHRERPRQAVRRARCRRRRLPP